jgi:hypothetical protein
MSKKIKIFITVFVLVIIIALGIFWWVNRNKVNTDENVPWYKDFNPFGTSTKTPVGGNGEGIPTGNPNEIGSNNANMPISKFYQITDFAVAGATFLEDTRLKTTAENTEPVPETKQVTTKISIDTKEGRKEIQTILNDTLSLNPPLVVDGVFGKKVTTAINDFQKLNNHWFD